jgi:Ca2+-transporting ATPase
MTTIVVFFAIFIGAVIGLHNLLLPVAEMSHLMA